MVEMNCFLCHLPDPANDARMETLQAGDFAWANTATLLNTGIVSKTVDGFAWNPAALTEDGELAKEHVTVQDPSNANCGHRHGVVHDDLDVPLVLDDVGLDTWSTLTTGQISRPSGWQSRA
ncbi:MAG: hypothetical protein R2838_08950 [Caldilineaceae bacterium]